MIHTTLPTMEQLLGRDSWDVLKKNKDSVMAFATDLAVLQGAEQNDFCRLNTIYMTKSANDTGAVRVIDKSYGKGLESPWCPYAVRLVLPAESVLRGNCQIHGAIPGGKRVTWGEYPQTALKWGFERDVEDKLSKLYKQGKLKKTGKSYTFYADSRPFRFQSAPEYEYNGGKYVRLPKKCCHPQRGARLPEGGYVCSDSEHWLKVQPVEWLVDTKTGNWISKFALFSMPITDHDYDGYFRATPLARHLRQHIDFELLPTAEYKEAIRARDAQKARLETVLPNRNGARKVFSALRGDEQLLMAELLSQGTPERDRTAKTLKKLRYQAYDAGIKAQNELDYRRCFVESNERLAQQEEAEGERLMREHQEKANRLRSDAQQGLARAKGQLAAAERVASGARASLSFYWRKRHAERTRQS